METMPFHLDPPGAEGGVVVAVLNVVCVCVCLSSGFLIAKRPRIEAGKEGGR